MHPAHPPRKSVPAQSRPTAAFTALIVANLLLSFGAVFVRLADTGPVASAFWRVTLAAPVLILLARRGAGGRLPIAGPVRWALIAGGVAFALDLGAWHLGILRTTLANATLLGNSATILYPVYGFIAARTLPNRRQGIALILALIGAALLMGQSYQVDPRHFGGDLLCLAAGILYTIYLVFLARARDHVAPLPALAMSSVASTLPLLLLALMLGERVMPHDWTPLLALALSSQVIGQGLMIYAIGRLSPLVVGLALLTQPVVAATTGWIAYGEALSAADAIGAMLVAVALVLVRDTDKERGGRGREGGGNLDSGRPAA